MSAIDARARDAHAMISLSPNTPNATDTPPPLRDGDGSGVSAAQGSRGVRFVRGVSDVRDVSGPVSHDPATWPLDVLLAEIRRMRSLRAELLTSGCPTHALDSADAEIARLVVAARRCEACRHRDLEPGHPACRLLLLAAGYLSAPVVDWLAAPARPNDCAHFQSAQSK